MKKGKYEDASGVLAALKDLPKDDEAVQDDITRIRHSIDGNAAIHSGNVRNLLRMGESRIFNRAMIAILGMSSSEARSVSEQRMLTSRHTGQLFQQMCGTSITVAYATSIFEERLGFDAVKSRGGR